MAESGKNGVYHRHHPLQFALQWAFSLFLTWL